ncbi:hypothetical protein SIL77_12885 [Exiguobacterium profundum]|uniref:hypothetical protein n=1 Tax=Exiguobacterium profundum TaxID=307643 RepID=UPI0029C45358|nr:hypothetical protein [Exiguobacterium profundum]MDX5982152.1 hypothetical protein [Exiguobacterium profundum]
MLKFIWNSWWRNKERFILLMVGMLIVSTGLSYLLGVTQANNGTVVKQKQIEKRFHFVLGIISLFVFTSPEVKPVTEEAKAIPAPTAQTTGAKQADLTKVGKNSPSSKRLGA